MSIVKPVVPLVVKTLHDMCLFFVATETDDPLTKVNDYTRFLAQGRTTTDVIWSSIYEDAGGRGLIASAVLPFYSADVQASNGEKTPGVLIGVIGHDALVSQFAEAGADPDDIIERLSRRGHICQPLSLNDCQMQVWSRY